MTETPTGGAAAPAVAAAPAPPTNAAEAAARLSVLQNDGGWTQRLFAGDEIARAEFFQLTGVVAKGDPVDAIIAGLPPNLLGGGMADSSVRELSEAVPFLREAGLADDVIRQVFTDQEVTKQEYDLAVQWKAQRSRDQEWTKKFLAGDGEANREMMLANIILASTIKDSTNAF